ncbi:NHL repeat-containing protein [Acidobacteriota bacterium]
MNTTFNKFSVSMLILMFALSGLNAQTTETVDGVKVVHNGKLGKWGKSPQVTLELVKTLGDIEADDENIAFYMPVDIAVDAEGNWYVLDSGNHRIQKFDADGNYLDTFGGQGQGPGEFAYPASIDLDSKGYMYVSDPQNQRVQILDPDGNEYKTIRMTTENIGDVRIFNSDQLIMGGSRGVMMMGMGDDEPKELPKLMKLMDTDGNISQRFGEQFNFKNQLVNRSGNQINFALDNAGNVYVEFPYQNRIDKYSPDGKLLWKSDRALNFSMDPPKNKGKVERSGGNVSIRMPQMNRCSYGIAADEKGRVWVVTLDRQLEEDERVGMSMSVSMSGGQRSMNMKPQGNTEITETDALKLQVFDTDGFLLGEIPLENFVDAIRIHKDRLFLIDRLRGTKFYEYKIIDK